MDDRSSTGYSIGMVDPVTLTKDLIRCRSVTPEDDGAISRLETVLADAGFATEIIERHGIKNLFARWGSGKTIGFNGHTDVVPTGPEGDWTHPPFAADTVDGILYGRGAVDMKSGVAAFVSAAVNFVRSTPPDGSIVIAITGDEEGDAIHGTKAILDWMQDRNERMDYCLVGEPTCPEVLGDMVKIGRRGSMTAYLTATGRQGHSAYPHRANNPLPILVRLLDRLYDYRLDVGTEHFDPSTLAITTIDTGNSANNVIPASTTATVNIRFNDAHSSASLIEWMRAEIGAATADTGIDIDARFQVSGESFLTPPGAFSDLVVKAICEESGHTPELSTSGGTSDARFIKDHCPVVEFGLVGRTMHQVDECVPVEEVAKLAAIYARILDSFFSADTLTGNP